MIKPNQRCKSECSLYINNPNSEDTQLNYPSVDGILHDREKIDENFSSITVIKKVSRYDESYDYYLELFLFRFSRQSIVMIGLKS